MNTDELRERLDALFPQLVDELSQLVAIPSVSSDPSHAADVDRSAEHIQTLGRPLLRVIASMDAELLTMVRASLFTSGL